MTEGSGDDLPSRRSDGSDGRHRRTPRAPRARHARRHATTRGSGQSAPLAGARAATPPQLGTSASSSETDDRDGGPVATSTVAPITHERAERIARAHACENCGEYSFKKLVVKPASAALRDSALPGSPRICGVCGAHQELGIDEDGDVVFAGVRRGARARREGLRFQCRPASGSFPSAVNRTVPPAPHPPRDRGPPRAARASPSPPRSAPAARAASGPSLCELGEPREVLHHRGGKDLVLGALPQRHRPPLAVPRPVRRHLHLLVLVEHEMACTAWIAGVSTSLRCPPVSAQCWIRPGASGFSGSIGLRSAPAHDENPRRQRGDAVLLHRGELHRESIDLVASRARSASAFGVGASTDCCIGLRARRERTMPAHREIGHDRNSRALNSHAEDGAVITVVRPIACPIPVRQGDVGGLQHRLGVAGPGESQHHAPDAPWS